MSDNALGRGGRLKAQPKSTGEGTNAAVSRVLNAVLALWVVAIVVGLILHQGKHKYERKHQSFWLNLWHSDSAHDTPTERPRGGREVGTRARSTHRPSYTALEVDKLFQVLVDVRDCLLALTSPAD